MFDVSKIRFVGDAERANNTYSFVGLQKNMTGGLEFWLPLGFDGFPKDFQNTKKFFFQMYRTFQVYRDRKLANDSDALQESMTNDRDGIFEQNEKGFNFINKKDSEETVFYGKLNALDKILQGYDELRIAALEKKQVRSQQIDYSKIYKYMHQAVFLEDDVIYLDEMNIAKNIILQESPTIVQMFCFIYSEIKTELEEYDSVPNRVLELSDELKNKHLHPQGGLFAEDTFADTLETLKILLEEVEAKTIYKDEDFWHFFEAVEAFLYGEKQNDDQGIYFGISSFADVWEDMCQSYMLAQPEVRETVLFADIDGSLKTRKSLGFKPNFEKNPFILQMDNQPRQRCLRPDLVLLSKSPTTSTNEIYNARQIPPKNYKIAYSVYFSNYLTIPETHPAIFEKFNELIISEPNKKTGGTFKYMTADNFKIFERFVQNQLNKSSAFTVIDYKYLRQSDYEKYAPNAIDNKGENKIKTDIHKQLVYEWALQQNFEYSKTESEFWIPYFPENMNFKEFKKDITARASDAFKASQIKIFQINFKILQEHYVKQQPY